MPQGTREIEVKYRLNSSDAEALEHLLTARGVVLSDPVHQDDQAYAPVGWAYGQPKVGVPFARLRTCGGRHLFTVKKPLDNEMACLEAESEVADRGQMHVAIEAMGFYPTVRIVKSRRTARLDGMELCVDQVERAGLFLEIEKVIDAGEESGRAAQAELDRFARSLGLELERVTDTYDSLVRSAALVNV